MIEYQYMLGGVFLFGYVKAYKPELKIKHYEEYRGVYCSVCRALGKRYGLFARLTLSYDFTFFALLRLCTNEEKPCFQSKKCPFNPAKTCNFCLNCDNIFDYIVDIGIISVYYKIKDNIHDDGFFKRILMLIILPLFAYYHKKAKKRCPYAEQVIFDMMKAQAEKEISNTEDIDIASHSTASCMGELLSHGFEDSRKKIFYRIGYCLGRFVYLCDAYYDMEKDEKHGCYNPFLLNKKTDDEIKKLLFVTLSQLQNAYELIEPKQFDDVIRNIIYDGMYETIENKEKKGKKDEKSL